MSLRVLHVLDHSLPLQSGYSFRTRSILRQQRALGWDPVAMTSPRHRGDGPAEEVADGLTFHRTPFAAGAWSRLPAGGRYLDEMKSTARRLDELVCKLRPDILHPHSPVLDALPALWVGRRHRIPVVYEIRASWEDAAVDHGTTSQGSLRYRASRAIETFAAQRADAVTTICEGLRGDLVARGIDERKITVIPNAVDTASFAFGRTGDEQLRSSLGLAGSIIVGFAGSFYAYEGLDLLLDAVTRLLADGRSVKVLLVGGGPQEQALREQARRLSIADRVVFTGRVPHGQVQRYYELIDVLAYPRRSMRLTEIVTPLKPLEAMAQGRMLVASDVGGHRELIRHGETGWLFKAGDPVSLARAIDEVLSERQRWPSIAAVGRRFVEEERTWARSVERYHGVYQRVLEKTLAQPLMSSAHRG